MPISLKDNYNSINYYPYAYVNFDTKVAKKEKNIVGNGLEIILKDYISEKYPNNTFFSFFKDEEKKVPKNQDDLIITIKKDSDDNYLAQTGNYVGNFVWQGLEIDIRSRFSNNFLERMLNFANDVFLDDVSITGQEDSNNELEISKYIIFYMFVQNLEKSFLLGLPKSYTSIDHHEMKVKGKIDINRFIKHDIPFQGKVSSVSREQKEIQEIIDVLYKAVKIIETNKFPSKNISHIKTHLKQHRSNKYVSNETINKALKSKALRNPIFAPYKKVLEYARIIINGENIKQNDEGNVSTYGFLINIAELFEIYIIKLLQNEFPDWYVDSPPLRLDKEFGDSYLYSRKIIPDITMIHRNSKDVMVFDTKYKRMKFNEIGGNGVDIDRCDFFQINTYMNYYNNQEKYNLLAGGLLYPIEEDFDNKFDEDGSELDHMKKKAHANSWFGTDIKFIIDGIDLSNLNENSNISDFENKFIKRIKHLINQT